MTAATGPADGRCAAAELLAAMPDPLTELELRRLLAREAYEGGRADGWREGYEAAAADMARQWQEVAAPVVRGTSYEEIEQRRWTVRGEQRSRETFGQPHQDDYRPRSGRGAAA